MRWLYHSARIQEHCPVFFNLLKKCRQTVLPRVISPNIINKVYELRILATFPEGRYPCTVFLRVALDCVDCGLERLDYFPTESPRAHNSLQNNPVNFDITSVPQTRALGINHSLSYGLYICISFLYYIYIISNLGRYFQVF